MVLAHRVVVSAGRCAELVATAANGPQGAVEEFLEFGELVVDVDIAFSA
ncbi:Uncharacterised protein [Mycobacterium tuberculosis]|uniref:Uncharacterized protein n=1 Tax=Mycobacterium tuberculosis TaxID=1773 RepID=A0A916PHB4_MYCTX|nr:Uncharacterised protein [Mycobacterium tuberculosis]COW36531.1 Uncharacterised protein [Mycobacterium tuberculosis]CPA21983.1 Uncharacterised protein [Mycobacterium tuberculosis]